MKIFVLPNFYEENLYDDIFKSYEDIKIKYFFNYKTI